jgi:phosphohistidine phosphatase
VPSWQKQLRFYKQEGTMILYFLRHGLAGVRQDGQGDDAKRPLTKKGVKNMRTQARTLARLDLQLDVIITSPLTRALQTAEIVAGGRKVVAPLEQDERLAPGFSRDALGQVLAEHSQAKHIMLVGHEPEFSLTISALIGGGKVILKKGSLARVDITATDPLQGDLVWLLPPKVMRL